MLYYVLRPIGWLICKILFRLKVEGLKNLPEDDKLIIVANHASYLDPVVISAAVPKRIHWVVRKDVYHVWWLKGLFLLTGMIPENGAVGSSLRCLESGKTVAVFPEGTRSGDGGLQLGRKGAAILAAKTGVPVIPCVVKGTFEAYPRTAILPKPRPVRVIIGPPIKFDKSEDPDETTINSVLDRIMSSIESLMERGDETAHKIDKAH